MNQSTLFNIVEDHVVFRTEEDINEHLKNTITGEKSEDEKIKDRYQLPYAILAIKNMLTDIPPEFPIEEILQSNGVQNCPPYLKECIKHAIKQVISPAILGIREKGDELTRLFKSKKRYMKSSPANIADAYSELTRRLQRGSKGDERRKNRVSLEWYTDHVHHIGLFAPFLGYDRKNIRKAFMCGEFPTGEEFYEQDASDISDILDDLEDEGQITTAKATNTAMLVDDNDKPEDAMYVNNKKKKFTHSGAKYVDWMPNSRVICGICRKVGHIGARCPERKSHPEYSKSQLFNSKLAEFFEDNQYSKAQNYRAVVKCKAKPTVNQNIKRTIVDGGATVTCFADDKQIQDRTPCCKEINTANGVTIATEKGTFDDGVLKIRNVYVLPKLDMNLISMHQLTEEGYTFQVTKRELLAFKGEKIIFRAPKIDGSWEYPNNRIKSIAYTITLTTEDEDEIMRTHVLSGCGSPAVVRQLMPTKTNLTDKTINEVIKKHKCTCLQNVQKAHGSKTLEAYPLRPGERVHIDTVGPRNGGYLVMITDAATKYIVGRTTTTKADLALQTRFLIKHLTNILEPQGYHINNLRCDNEYGNNRKIKYFLFKHGIEVESTAGYSSHQNGVAENSNMQIQLMARKMLSRSKVPMAYLPFAYHHAILIHNLSATMKDSKSPFQKMFGYARHWAHYIPFGCRIFVYDEANTAHISTNSKPATFLGYDKTAKIAWYVEDGTGRIGKTNSFRPNNYEFPFKDYPVDEDNVPQPGENFNLNPEYTDLEDEESTSAGRTPIPGPIPSAATGQSKFNSETHNLEPMDVDPTTPNNPNNGPDVLPTPHTEVPPHDTQEDAIMTDIPSNPDTQNHISVRPQFGPPLRTREPSPKTRNVRSHVSQGTSKMHKRNKQNLETTIPRKLIEHAISRAIAKQKQNIPDKITINHMTLARNIITHNTDNHSTITNNTDTSTAQTTTNVTTDHSTQQVAQLPPSRQPALVTDGHEAMSGSQPETPPQLPCGVQPKLIQDSHQDNHSQGTHEDDDIIMNDNPDPGSPARKRTHIEMEEDMSKGYVNANAQGPDAEPRTEDEAQAMLAIAKGKYIIPKNAKEQRESPQRTEWDKETDAERDGIGENNGYESIHRYQVPNTERIIQAMVIRSIKDEGNNRIRFKARCVAKGFQQTKGINYEDTFSPVVRHSDLRMMFALATIRGWHARQLDAKRAFLNGRLKNPVYLRPPEEMRKFDDEIWVLHKALYGLKQAPFIWYTTLRKALVNLGFTMNLTQPCIAFKKDCIITIYVDDLIIFGETEEIIQREVRALSKKFVMKDLGTPSIFLGMNINFGKDKTELSLEGFTQKVAEDFNIVETKQIKQPIPKNVDIEIMKENVQHENGSTKVVIKEPLSEADQKVYQTIVGIIQYMSTMIRFDIAYAASFLGRYSKTANKKLLNLAKNVLRYTVQTKDFKIIYRRNQQINTAIRPTARNSELQEYPAENEWSLMSITDANLDTNPETYAPQYGFMTFLNNNLIQWETHKRSMPCDSTAQSEFMVYTDAWHACCDEKGSIRVLEEMNIKPSYLKLVNDNQSALKISTCIGDFKGSRTLPRQYKQISTEVVVNRKIRLYYIAGEENPADMLTKSLNRAVLLRELKTINQ